MTYEDVGLGWLIWFDRGEWYAKHDQCADDFSLVAKTRAMILVMIECRTGVTPTPYDQLEAVNRLRDSGGSTR